jgi:hypothetical protein
MAVVFKRSGDRFLKQQGISGVPKTFSSNANYVAAWNTTRTTPNVGDLVKIDTATDDGVLQCVASEVPYGIVDSVNSNNGTLTVIKFSKAFSLILEVPATSGVTRGHSIQANGSLGTLKIGGNLRDQVKDVAFAVGSGTIVAIYQAGTPGLIVVEFPGLTTTGG